MTRSVQSFLGSLSGDFADTDGALGRLYIEMSYSYPEEILEAKMDQQIVYLTLIIPIVVFFSMRSRHGYQSNQALR